MYTSLFERLGEIEGDIVVPEELKKAAKEALATEAVAAYKLLAEPLQMLLETVSADGYEDHVGVKSLPQGPEYYLASRK